MCIIKKEYVICIRNSKQAQIHGLVLKKKCIDSLNSIAFLAKIMQWFE